MVMSMSARVRWPFLLAAALAIAAAVLTHVWPLQRADAAADESLPTAAQARPAAALAASLPTVAGTARDRYDTACGAPVPYCVTSTTVSAHDMATAIDAMLVARGARTTRRLSCDGGDSNDPYSLGDCDAALTFRGVNLGVIADSSRDFSGVGRPARAYVVIGAEPATAVSRPLPNWSALRLLPREWEAPRCVRPAPGRTCLRYDGLLRIHQSLDRTIRAVRSSLVSSGLAVEDLRCTAASATHRGCFIAGQKFRSLDGGDPLNVFVLLRAVGARETQAHVLVTN